MFVVQEQRVGHRRHHGAGVQGLAGNGLALQGEYVTLPTTAVAPDGYTFVGTTVLTLKNKVGKATKTTTKTLNVYQKD